MHHTPHAQRHARAFALAKATPPAVLRAVADCVETAIRDKAVAQKVRNDWLTYPPNGWGCRCDVSGISAASLRADGLTPDRPSAVDSDAVAPAFQYHVGEAASGKPIAKALLAEERGGELVQLDDRGPEDFNRPARMPLDTPTASPGIRTREAKALRDAFKRAIGGNHPRVLAA